MSQKSTRRARRQTIDDDSTPKAPTPTPKAPTPKPEEVPPPAPAPIEEKKDTPVPPEEPPTEKEAPKEQESTENETKSRSATPQVKLANGHEDEDMEATPKEAEEMDPLIVADEPDPELVFEENSDLESGKESPVISRCKTRRSLTRNIPTPKTPKSVVEEEEQQEELNATFESCSDNVSTKAEPGGDSTHLNYTEDTNSFLQGAKNKSFGETLRHLSTRRTIRPISVEYRKRIVKADSGRGDLSASYPSRNSVERVSVGVKRSCSEGEEEFNKRFKSDSPGFFAKFTSPLASIRNTFRADLPSSTPKLTGYKDDKFLLEDDNSKMFEVKDGERRWCSIM